LPIEPVLTAYAVAAVVFDPAQASSVSVRRRALPKGNRRIPDFEMGNIAEGGTTGTRR
jgi:hypothetical protein